MSHPSSRAAVTACPIVLAAALLWAVPGRPRAGRHPAGALGAGERANEDLGRDGDPAVEGLRLGAGDLAGDARWPTIFWQARDRAEEIAVERFVSAGSSNRHETIWNEAFRRLTRRLRRGSGLRPSLQISPFLRVSPVNPAGNATYDVRTHQVIHAARRV